MNRNRLVWILGAVGVLGVGAVTVVVGRTLMPPRTTAETVGTLVPWFLTWGMIWMTALIAVIIAVNMFAIGLKDSPSQIPNPPDQAPAPSTPDARLR